VLAIIATLIALLLPAIQTARGHVAGKAAGPSQPPGTWLLTTVKHDDHWWVMAAASATVPAAFCHHPDCPCQHRKPEAE